MNDAEKQQRDRVRTDPELVHKAHVLVVDYFGGDRQRAAWFFDEFAWWATAAKPAPPKTDIEQVVQRLEDCLAEIRRVREVQQQRHRAQFPDSFETEDTLDILLDVNGRSVYLDSLVEEARILRTIADLKRAAL